MVSEIMLQQTQVARVIPKYQEFLEVFPNVKTLATAQFSEVLQVWSGLGYNRRAKYLLEAAKAINTIGQFPKNTEALEKLPGIGKNTAGAICVYAFNQPEVFIETNIRTVFIHHFFKNQTDIDDKHILSLVKATLPQEGKEQPEWRINSAPGAGDKTVGLSHHREWYWALMDYGSFLKATVGNVSKHSKHYTKQSRFEGSVRQLRAAVLRALLSGEKSMSQLQEICNDDRLESVTIVLRKEGLISKENDKFRLE